MIDVLDKGKTTVSLEELAVPFSHHILSHLKENDKQGSSTSSKFPNTCRSYQQGSIARDELIEQTTKLGFVNVVDAFQNVNGAIIKDPFYEKNYAAGKKEIILTDAIHKLKESIQYGNLDQEVDARWRLVETAWNLNINPKLLEVKHDSLKGELFVETDVMH